MPSLRLKKCSQAKACATLSNLNSGGTGFSLWIVRITMLLALAGCAFARVDRVVILKVDGLPEVYIERYIAEAAGGNRAGHSRLPWIEQVFVKNGTWMQSFYVRGVSLSSPSWSELDTGRHLEIRGNAEWDRYTLRVYDYMNFFPLYLNYARNHQADMPGVEVLDENSVPLLIDRFPPSARYQSFQLYQRGVRWATLEGSLKSEFSGKSVRQLFDEWQTGWPLESGISTQQEKELEAKLRDPAVRYLDLFTGDFDHTAHLTGDPVTLQHTLEELDALIGRLWAAISAGPLARTTAFLLVSDHGMNVAGGIYSQGCNLVDWFNSAAGGAHPVVLPRHPMTEFKLRGLDPFVSEVITPTNESTYLNGESARYPTAVLDLDGNERASIGLRNNSLNIVHVLLDQLIRKKVTAGLRRATIDALFATLNHVRTQWTGNVEGLADELTSLRAGIAREQAAVDRLPKKWSDADRALALDLDAKRRIHHLEQIKTDERLYSSYVTVMRNLLALDPADFDPGKFNIEELIPHRSLGDSNSVYDLQNYVAGPAKDGLQLAPDGSLDMERSFRRVDYFSALSSIRVRNNVQKDVGPQPVDFIAVPLQDAVWLWRSPERQALIFARHDLNGALELHYVPIAHLKQDADGTLHFDRAEWAAGFPLEIFEDPMTNVEGDRARWLDAWHSDADWLKAVHRTRYSNGVIGIVEALLHEPVADPFLERKRELRGFDMIVFASDHWNFNVRSFNPGGNHGSFLRVSTHSVLMVAGGDDTGIPRNLRVAEPYDSLSLVPTILTLMGKPEPSLPGPVIAEVLR